MTREKRIDWQMLWVLLGPILLLIGCASTVDIDLVRREIATLRKDVADLAKSSEAARTMNEDRLRKLETETPSTVRELRSTVKESATDMQLGQRKTEEITSLVRELQMRLDEADRQMQLSRRRIDGIEQQLGSGTPQTRPTAPASLPAPTATVAPPAATAAEVSAPPKEVGVEVVGLKNSAGAGAGKSTALGQYLGLVEWRIQQNWIPLRSSFSSETGVVVRFRVLRSGQLRETEIESSSGNASLDAAAIRTIRQSVPFPTFPAQVAEPSLDLRYRFLTERR